MSAGKEDGGPAFPIADQRDAMGNGICQGTPGMSLRDYFAGQALAGMIDFGGSISYEMDEKYAHIAAETAFKFADAMLKARKP